MFFIRIRIITTMSKVDDIALEKYPVIMTTLLPAHDDMPELHQDSMKWCRETYTRGFTEGLKYVKDFIKQKIDLINKLEEKGCLTSAEVELFNIINHINETLK